MSDPYLQTVEINPHGEPQCSVVWLHGLGADGHDFEPIVPELGLPEAAGVRFVFPHAPVRPVTVNGGMPMRAWYDIVGIGQGYPQDAESIRSSAEQVGRLIERENKLGIPSSRIVLAGFSQGGAIALHAGLRYPERLAGVMGLSTYLPLPEDLTAERSQANADVPVFMGHGVWDQVVPHGYGSLSRERLVEAGYSVEWHEYRMEHSVVMDEIRDIAAWLRRVLAIA